MKIDDVIRSRIDQKLEQWVRTFPEPDSPIIGVAGDDGDDMLTPRQIAENVHNRTPQGEEFLHRWMEMVVDHVMDAQLEDSQEQESDEATASEASW